MKKAKDPESVPLVVPKKTAPQPTKPKPPKPTKKTEPEEETLMKTPMIKSAAGIKVSKEEQMKIQNQKIADDFFDQEGQENAMLVMRLPNTVGAAGSDDDSDDEKSSSPVKKGLFGPGRAPGEKGATIQLGVVPEEAEESQHEMDNNQ